MKLFFVIGEKTSKSLSPLIFNHWFKKYKIKARYFFIETKKQNFKKIISQTILEKKISGFNITIPYKKTIFNFLDIKNSHAKKIQAVNCVTLGEKTKGINTDWVGYKAIIYSFVSEGFKNIIVFKQTKKFIKLGGVKRYTKKYSLVEKHLEKADLLINTTPINPLNKKQSKAVSHKTVVSDIVYNPKNTVFLKQFKSNLKIYGI